MWVDRKNWVNDLSVSCWDEDDGADDLIGQTTVSLLDLMAQGHPDTVKVNRIYTFIFLRITVALPNLISVTRPRARRSGWWSFGTWATPRATGTCCCGRSFCLRGRCSATCSLPEGCPSPRASAKTRESRLASARRRRQLPLLLPPTRCCSNVAGT
jgi:hypothetical protein